MSSEHTKLRFLIASDHGAIENAVNNLTFKIEIKNGPDKFGSKWIIWFVLPDHVQKWESIDIS